MTSPSEDLDQAFPAHFSFNRGMTLRDYFAAKAMMHFLQTSEEGYDEVAEDAYLVADAMLHARDGQA